MAGSLNKVVILGNLVNDPDFRLTGEGKEIASITVATVETWKDRATSEKREKSEWHRVVVFNDLFVELLRQHCKKGSRVYIEGVLQTRKWTDSSGVEKYTTEIVLQNFNSNLIPMSADDSNTQIASINKINLIGNLGRDPEFRSTAEGKEIALVSIATSETWKDRLTHEKREKTEWHRVVVFSEGLVPLIRQYLKKGSKIYLEGALQTRKWTDTAGQEKYTTEVVLQNFTSNIIFLDSRSFSPMSNHESPTHSATKSHNNFEYSEIDDDNVPF